MLQLNSVLTSSLPCRPKKTFHCSYRYNHLTHHHHHHNHHYKLKIKQKKYRNSSNLMKCKATTAPANSENASSMDVEEGSPDAIRKYLTSIGWDKSWIDTVTERVVKRQLITDVNICKQATEYLMSLGLTEYQICNMVSLCYNILSCPVETHLKPIVEFLKKRNVNDVPSLLRMHPKILDYNVSKNGNYLEKGKLRADIHLEMVNGKESVAVIIFREGAKFNTAPLTPWTPKI